MRPIYQRKNLGDYYTLYREMRVEDPEMFFHYTRMSKKMFDELFILVGPQLSKKSNRPTISPECRLLVTLGKRCKFILLL